MQSFASLYFLAGIALSASAAAAEPHHASTKRGLAFAKNANNPINQGRPGSEYTKLFEKYRQITWMYNWEGVIDGQAADFEYVPMLHDDREVFTAGWADGVSVARSKYRAKYVLSFNEPDDCHHGGACMTPDRAAAAHREYVQPLAQLGLKIGSPAVTSSADRGKGVDWLKDFLVKCNNCQIDFIVVHWYGWDKFEDFKRYAQSVHTTFCLPIWITEFGISEGDPESFLRDALPWMDQQAWIERYSYFLLAPSTSDSHFLIDTAGTGLSSTGLVYATT